MFSAVVFVPFLFVRMANNEVKEVETKPIKKKELKFSQGKESKALPDLTCRAVKFQAYLDSLDACFTPTQASGNSYSVYFACLQW